MGATLRGLSDASTTLAEGRDDLARTVRNLAAITATMAEDDREIRTFIGDLARVSRQLNGEREELRATFKALSGTLSRVADFVEDNRGEVTANTKDLAHLTRLLVRHRESLGDFLDVAALGVNNANNAYDARSRTFGVRFNLNGQIDDLARWLCSLAYSMGTSPSGCEPLLEPLNGVGEALNRVRLDTSAPDLTLGGLLPPPARPVRPAPR